LKPPVPLPTPIKWKEWELLSKLPSGDNTFSRFQKGHVKVVILKMPVPLSTPIKCKVKTIGPLSGSSLKVPPGD